MSPGEVVLEGVVVEQPAEPATAGEVFGFYLPSVEYVGREGIVGLISTHAVVDVFAMDRGLFDAANAAKARTHWLHGRPGNLGRTGGMDEGTIALGGGAVLTELCCVPPVWSFMSVILFPFVVCCGLALNRRNPHEDMAIPDWADRALVITDKGVLGRRAFTAKEGTTQPDAYHEENGGINAITWNGFRIGDVRIQTFDSPSCMCSTPVMPPICPGMEGLKSNDPRFDGDPLILACYFGLCCACCRYTCFQPEAPGLYRATISSVHTTTVSDQDTSRTFPTASIEVLALARSPDDLRNSLRAAKEKYGAPKAAKMAR